MIRNIQQTLMMKLQLALVLCLISVALVRADVIVQAGTIDVDSKLYVEPSTGNVGIGAIPPSQKLDVLGAARLQPIAQPATLANGVIYYDSAANKFKCYEEGTLKNCITASSGGSLPAGTFGQTLWHDENNWIASSLLNNTDRDMVKIQKDNEVHLSLRNIEEGGRDWAIVSAGSAGGIGKGNFSIYDKTLGVSRLVVDSAGNVGIGTTVPGALLQVGANTDGYFQISNQQINHFYLTETNPRTQYSRDLLGSGLSGWGFGPGGATTIAAGGSAIGYPASRSLGLYTSNGAALTERLRVDSSGNVGIGAPVPAYKLDVVGTGRFDNSLSFTNAGAARGYIYGHVAATTMGFGTDRDRMLLTNGNDGLRVYDLTTSSKYAGFGHDSTNVVITSSTGDVTISPAGTSNPFVVQKTSGNVGIGLSPAAANKLDVAGKIHASGDICTDLGGCLSTATGGVSSGWTEDVAGNKVYVTNPGRNAGIGTDLPNAKLEVADAANPMILISNGNPSIPKQLKLNYDIGSNYGQIESLDNGVSAKLVVNLGGGGVGVGKIPAANVKLDVNGVVVAACPSDMTSTGTVCIETTERAAATWFAAIDACGDAGRRLCSVSEWYYACLNFPSPSLQLMTDNFEWTDDRTRGAATQGVYTLGSTQCDNSQVTQDSSSLAYRCCIDRKLSS